MAETAPRTYGFQAEVRQLLHLMVHSLYSEREIFLRELISNASDASDRLRFEALGKPDLLAGDAPLEIVIRADKDAGVITIADSGIGMSESDVIDQLGTIAHSGTSRFLEQLGTDQRNDAQLIGQFGVGFYSAFIVADEVEVHTRRAGEPAATGVLWRSDGQGEFSVEPREKATHGTEIRLKLKADAQEFLDEYRVRGLIHKYSDHIAFPVKLASDSANEAETVNQAQALWTRPRGEISDEEYREFYKHITHDLTDPLGWSHNRVEGKREYTSLLYLPAVAPFDLWNREAPRGLKLYVQRVFITDHATHFLPLYLRFVRGIVDARDLSLNVSREMLQQDPHVGAIRAALTKRALDLIGKMADEPEKYRTFWQQFGSVLKEGLAEDTANRERVASLLRFHSTASSGTEPDRSLDAYLAAMPASQDKIDYLIGDSLAVARSSPHLEAFRERSREVLLLTDRIDEWMMQYLSEYKGKPLRDITRGTLDLDAASPDKKKAKALDAADETFVKRVKAVLGERIDEVRISTRLTASPACLVLGDHDLGFHMREMLKAVGHDAPETKPSLELNSDHALIRRLRNETADARFERLASIVLDQAMLTEGRHLDDPAAYVRRVNEFLGELGIGDA